MLGKKRQILFDVLGERTRLARTQEAPVRVVEAPPARVAAAPRRAARKKKPMPKLNLAMSRATAAWCAAAAVTMVGVVGVVWAANRGGKPDAPVLQVNAPNKNAVPPERFGVCVLALEYKTPAERAAVAKKVQETVNYLRYDAGPGFDDVWGQAGKDPDRGTFRVWVGEARSRAALIPLERKLAALERKRTRPFQDARVRPIDA